MRRVALTLLCILALGSGGVMSADSWTDTTAGWATRLADGASKLVKQLDSPSLLTEAVNGVYKRVTDLKTVTDKTWVSEKDLQKVAEDISELNAIEVEVPESLNSKSAYQKITAGVRDPGTISAGNAELERLQKAADQREKLIAKMSEVRGKAQDLADRYQGTADVAEKLSRDTEHLVGDIGIEIASRVAGGSFSLSWIQFATDVVPALNERASAAKSLVKRHNNAIKAAEADLKVFNENKALATQIWGGDIAATGAPNPAGQLTTLEIQRMARDMEEQDRAVEAASKALREEAAQIRAHNATISKYQQFLELVRIGVQSAQPASDSPSASNAKSETPASKPNAQAQAPEERPVRSSVPMPPVEQPARPRPPSNQIPGGSDVEQHKY